MNYTFYAFLEDYPNIDFFSTPDYIKNGFELVLKVDLRLIYDNIKQKYKDFLDIKYNTRNDTLITYIDKYINYDYGKKNRKFKIGRQFRHSAIKIFQDVMFNNYLEGAGLRLNPEKLYINYDRKKVYGNFSRHAGVMSQALSGISINIKYENLFKMLLYFFVVKEEEAQYAFFQFKYIDDYNGNDFNKMTKINKQKIVKFLNYFSENFKAMSKIKLRNIEKRVEDMRLATELVVMEKTDKSLPHVAKNIMDFAGLRLPGTFQDPEFGKDRNFILQRLYEEKLAGRHKKRKTEAELLKGGFINYLLKK